MENPAVSNGVSAILADPAKWRSFLDQFESVIKTNIFILDPGGAVLVPPRWGNNEKNWGWSLVKTTFGLDFQVGEIVLGNAFEPVPQGGSLSALDPLGLRLFAIPVRLSPEKILFYVVAGPLVVGERWIDERYRDMIRTMNFDEPFVMEQLRQVPVLSPEVWLASAELLAEVVKDVYEIQREKEKFSRMGTGEDSEVRRDLIDTVQGLLADIQQDEFLISVLDAAIKLAGAEGGSIMIYDPDKDDFVIKVSRGLAAKKSVTQSRVKLGEGIAGIAAAEKKPFVIRGTHGDERIRHLLQRPDIRQSFVVPIIAGESVVGVLNLSTKSDSAVLQSSRVQSDIEKFSPLIAAALTSF